MYSVDWSPDALAALALLWMQATDRNAVAVAQAEIDRLLATDPLGNGVPVSEGLYAIEVRPLRAQFEIAQAPQRVRVVSLGYLP